MEVHLYAWIITVVVMVAILAIDVLISGAARTSRR